MEMICAQSKAVVLCVLFTFFCNGVVIHYPKKCELSKNGKQPRSCCAACNHIPFAFYFIFCFDHFYFNAPNFTGKKQNLTLFYITSPATTFFHIHTRFFSYILLFLCNIERNFTFLDDWLFSTLLSLKCTQTPFSYHLKEP